MAHTPVVLGPGTPPIKRTPRPGTPEYELWWAELMDALLGHVGSGGPTPKSVNNAGPGKTTGGAIDAAPYLPLIYGRQRVKGQVFATDQGNVSNATFWIAVCEGEIDAIETLYVNGLNPFANATIAPYFGLTVFSGSAGQAEDSQLFNLLGFHQGGLPGTCYLKVVITAQGFNGWYSWQQSVPGGATNITFEVDVRGRKVYDPRLDSTVPAGSGAQRNNAPSTWTWNQNAICHWRDLRVNWSGVDNALVDDASLIAPANVCDSTFSGGTRFVSNLACIQQASLKSHLDQLALACNGYEAWPNAKLTLFVDIENANPPLLTLDSQQNFDSIAYSWVDRKDKPTQVRLDFRNKDASPPYMNDYVLVPATLGAGVESVLASFSSNVITDRVHAARAASYLYNIVNATPFRAEGDSTYVGITAIPRGTKIALTTSEGVAAQQMLVEVAREMQTGWHMQLRQYAAAVYVDQAVTTTQPISLNPNAFSLAPPPPAAARWVTGVGLIFDAPRVYAAGGPYGAAQWTVTGAASSTMSKINDGDLASVAITTTGGVQTEAILDLGVGVTATFGRVDSWTDAVLSYLPGSPPPILLAYFSDNGSSWTLATTENPATIETTPAWNEVPVGGIYPQHLEFPTAAVGAGHRYWKVQIYSANVVHVYEIRFSTFTVWSAATITGYQILPWVTFGPADPTRDVVLTVPTLPTSGSPLPLAALSLPVLYTHTFLTLGLGSDTQTWAMAITTLAVTGSSATAVPGFASITFSGSGGGSSGTLALWGASNTLGAVGAQPRNLVLAGPASGADALPVFRALVAADVVLPTAAARSYATANITFTTAVARSVPLDTNAFNIGTMWVTGSNTRLTVPAGQGGVYVIVGQITFNAGAGTVRQVMIYKNGSRIALASGGLVAGGTPAFCASIVDSPSAGDYYELWGYQDSGGNLNLIGAADLSFLSCARIE